MKKIMFCVLMLLCIVLFLPTCIAGTKTNYVTVNHIRDGDFERIGTGERASWSMQSAEVVQEPVHGGTYSMKISGKASDRIGQRVYDMVGGEDYSFTMWVWLETGDNALTTKFELIDKTGESINDGTTVPITHSISSGSTWCKIEWNFTAPPNADQGMFYILLAGAGTVYLDDISLDGAAEPMQDCILDEVPSGAQSLISSDFTATINKKPVWNYGTYVTIENDSQRGKVARIISPSADINPSVSTSIPIEVGCTYQVQCELKTTEVMGTGPRFKVEYYGDGLVGQQLSPVFNKTFGTWMLVGAKFSPPAGANRMSLYLRLHGIGDISYANVKVYKIAEPSRMTFGCSAFNYTDVGYGLAYARVNTETHEVETGAKIRFQILDGESEIYKYETELTEEVTHSFPINDLTEDKYYILKTSYVNKDGGIEETDEQRICKTARPTRITRDGLFKGYNDEWVVPVMGYHAGVEDFKQCADAGINVVQYNSGGSAAKLRIALDAAQREGIYLAVMLYDNGKIAGSTTNAARTENLVTKFRDHPAVFAWMVQDEPLWNDPYCYPVLFDSYELIHGLDRKNPVYLCQNSKSIDLSGVCDILAIDPYPGDNGINKVGDVAREASKATAGIQPLINIMQCFEDDFVPTADTLRNMAYQGYFMGVTGIGYFTVNDSKHSVLWNKEWLAELTDFNKTDAKEAHKAFCSGEYETLAEECGQDSAIWYKIYKTEDDEYYLIAINLEETEGSTTVPFSPENETRIFIRAEGEWGEATVLGCGQIPVIIPGQGAVKYKLRLSHENGGESGFRTESGDEISTGETECAVQPYVHLFSKEGRTVRAIIAQYTVESDAKELVSIAVYPLAIENGCLSADVGTIVGRAEEMREIKIILLETEFPLRPYIPCASVRLTGRGKE